PQHDPLAARGAVPRKVRCQRALAAASLAVDDCDDGHGSGTLRAGPARGNRIARLQHQSSTRSWLKKSTNVGHLFDGSATIPSMQAVKALVFDVFGPLVDWRTCTARETRAILEPLGIRTDWEKFADAWRDQYQPAMEEVRSGRLPFSKLDVLHRRNLDVV